MASATDTSEPFSNRKKEKGHAPLEREKGHWMSREPLVASLFLVVRPGAPSSILASSSDARSP